MDVTNIFCYDSSSVTLLHNQNIFDLVSSWKLYFQVAVGGQSSASEFKQLGMSTVAHREYRSGRDSEKGCIEKKKSA